MKMKEALLEQMSRMGELTKQTEMIDSIYLLTKGQYTKESLIGNIFRNTKNFPWFFSQFIKVKKGNSVFWRRGETTFTHNFDSKPQEYYDVLGILNNSNNIYTLCGTQSNCLKVLDRDKTTTVDFSPMVQADIKGDIFKIKKTANSSYNLDFEGIFSHRKSMLINELKADKIVLTFKSSKNDSFIENLNYKVTHIRTYKSRNFTMKIYLLEKSV